MKNNKSKTSCKQGFTLIELLIVVLIIGILAAVAVPQYRVAVMKSQYAEAQLLGQKIYQAEQIYFLANGKYTNDFSKLDLMEPNDEGELIGGNAYCHFNWISNTDGEVLCKLNDGRGNNSAPYFLRRLGSKETTCSCYNKRACRVCQVATGKTSSCVPTSQNRCNYSF